MSSERKEPTVSSVLSSKEELSSDRRSRTTRQQRGSRPTEPQRYASPPPSPSSSSGFLWFTFLITLVAVGGAGYALWQLELAKKTIEEQRTRIVTLEKKLTISDDTATQSLESVGAKVRELNKNIGELTEKSKVATSEIDKLWGTRNVNRKAIAEGKKQIESLQTSQKSDQKKLAALDKKATTLTAAIDDIDTLKSTVDSSSQTIGEQELLIQSLRERLNSQGETLKQASTQAQQGASAAERLEGVDTRLKSTEEVIKSLEAFRRTTNRDLLKLKGGK